MRGKRRRERAHTVISNMIVGEWYILAGLAKGSKLTMNQLAYFFREEKRNGRMEQDTRRVWEKLLHRYRTFSIWRRLK